MIKSFVKKCTLFTCAAILAGALTAESSVSSFAGAATDAGVSQDGNVTIKVRGVFAGQYTIDNRILFRGDFFINTDDILNGGLFQDTQASFTINEVTAAYRFMSNNSMHQVSGFLGRQESLGSDLFVKRYLGIRNFSSDFLSPQLNYAMPGIYTHEGLGVSYVVRLATPSAFGVYFTYDQDQVEDPANANLMIKAPNLNGDFRFAHAWDWGSFDMGFGLNLPIQHEDTAGADVILMLRKVDVRAGAAALLELTGTTSLFLQAGIIDVQVAPPQGAFKVTLDDMYLFIEPRFNIEHFTYATSFFCLPKNSLKNCVYAQYPIGFNIMAKSTDFLFLGHAARGGVHFSVSANSLTQADRAYDVQITPFVNYSLGTGTISVFSQIHPSLYQDPSKFINLSVGYKTIL